MLRVGSCALFLLVVLLNACGASGTSAALLCVCWWSPFFLIWAIARRVVVLTCFDLALFVVDALSCVEPPPAVGFGCEGSTWVYRGNFSFSGPAGSLVFRGSSLVLGDFFFQAHESNSVTFAYNSFLRVEGSAEFEDEANWRILVTPTEGRDLWRHHADRNLSYVQAASLKYNSNRVVTTANDACTKIYGIARTVNASTAGIRSQLIVVEFTDFKTFATCKVWWVIPLVFVIVLAIISIALFCYFWGRNKKKELDAYIPVPTEAQDDNFPTLHDASQPPLYGSLPEAGIDAQSHQHTSYGAIQDNDSNIN